MNQYKKLKNPLNIINPLNIKRRKLTRANCSLCGKTFIYF